jgi:endothelin-converting enzyme/putative endopeptidase
MIEQRSMALVLRLAVLWLATGCGGDLEPKTPASSRARPPGIDLAALDRGANPCDDFYQFACGGWIAGHPLGADAGYNATWLEPYYAEVETLWPIIRDSSPAAGDEASLISRYYQTCLSAPGDPGARQRVLDLQRLDSVASVGDLARAVAAFDRIGSSSFFWMYVDTDPGDPTRRLITVAPGGMELPDRSYYLEAQHADIRQRYLAHMRAVAGLLGVSLDVENVLGIETRLASAAPSPLDQREPSGLYHPMSLAELTALAPHFPWADYVEAVGFPGVDRVNVTSPSYLMTLDELLADRPLAQLRDYVRWQLLEDEARRLDQSVLDEEFSFHDRQFLGRSAPPARGWTCYEETTSRLGFQVAHQYLSRLFDLGARPAQQALIQEIKAAMRARLGATSWLDELTRVEAISKLDKVAEKVGYPDVWPPAPPFQASGTWLEVNLARNEAYHMLAVATLSQPVDRNEWRVPPITVNAFYAPDRNEIVFPAAIFRLPFFDAASGAAINHGAIAALMGHELTHAFDDSGRQFDGDGALRNWWSPDVERAFRERATCLSDAFSAREVLPGQHVNGIRTLGENIADLGGLNLAFDAWKASGTIGGPMARLSGDQQFFVGYAQANCARMAPEFLATLLAVDPHAPPRERVNVPLSQLDGFAEAFQCPAGSPMRRRPACAVW